MILIFAGAGASLAVNKEKYPTTIQFFNRLSKEIWDWQLFKDTIQVLKNKYDEEIIDVELVLWELNNLKLFLEEVISDEHYSLITHLLKDNKVFNKIAPNMKHGNFKELSRKTIPSINRLIQLINKNVFEFYSMVPEKKELKGNWNLLLDLLSETFNEVNLFTTNYDLILEEAIKNSKYANKIKTGRNEGIIKKIDIDTWTKKESQSLLTKLHGSIDWRITNNILYHGSIPDKNNDNEHLLIYPGFKGVPENSPYKEFHDYFVKSVKEAEYLVFIGFAFRDEYINNILEENLTQKQKLIIINPGVIPNAEKFKPIHIKENFNDQSIKKCMKELESF